MSYTSASTKPEQNLRALVAQWRQDAADREAEGDDATMRTDTWPHYLRHHAWLVEQALDGGGVGITGEDAIAVSRADVKVLLSLAPESWEHRQVFERVRRAIWVPAEPAAKP